MAGNYNKGKDSFEINELAALNEDITDEFIEQLQSQLASSVSVFTHGGEGDDASLFEETTETDLPDASNTEVEPVTAEVNVVEPAVLSTPEAPAEKKEEISVNKNFDDNFIKKYKAKLNKKSQSFADKQDYAAETPAQAQDNPEGPIEDISKGNITEKPLSKDQKEYNESLDFLDGNVKYSKYVIYIDPQNVDFIDGLTVKERKNLINGILRQQDDIAITKQRFKFMQTVIRQLVVAILTISIAIPLVYSAINASLEATIDNHRRSQTNWQVLYREHGKITQN